jgi:GntR family transcriptional regulator, transcriptional repressor for pyruvate dehydrogenase complex
MPHPGASDNVPDAEPQPVRSTAMDNRARMPRVKASMMIADELRHRIARGDFRPGDALPSETELTEELGYSKPTVREALRILENEGLIQVRLGLHGGPEVRQLSIDNVAHPMGVYLQISDVGVTDVWASRDRIIASAVERLASMADVDLAPLEAQVESLVGHVGDVSSFYLHMIATAEVAVELAGSATDHLVVAALRHVIEGELAAATEAVDDTEAAVDAERQVADAWRRALLHIGAGRHRAARAAFEQQARILQEHLEGLAEGATVGDAVGATREQRVHAHSLGMRPETPGQSRAS